MGLRILSPMKTCRSLLLVHGNGGGSFRFSRCLGSFQPDLQVRALSLPGFWPRHDEKLLPSMADYANALAQELAQLPPPRAVFGTGIGGSFILEMLREQASLVDRVILHAPVGAHLDRRLFPRLMSLPGVAQAARLALGHPILRPFWRRLFFETDLEPGFYRDFFDGYRYCKAFAQMFHLIDHAWWVSLKPCPVPGVLLWGGRERLLSPSQSAPFLQLLPGCQLRVVPSWRHFPMIEQPQEFAGYLEECL